MKAKMEENEKRILSGYSYDEEGPFFNIDTSGPGSIKRIRFHFRDKVFSIVCLNGRYCTGYYDLESFDSFGCPDAKRLRDEVKSNNCRSCNERSGFNPAFYNSREQLSPQQAKYNERPHIVYLANFGRGAMKVGIASEDRSMVRLLEQGARAAGKIARCKDAYRAREIEHAIHSKLGISEAMTARKKRELLSKEFNAGDAAREVRDVSARVRDLIGEDVERDPVIEDFTAGYFADNRMGLPLTDVTETSPMAISGKCVGMVGDVLFMENDGEFYMMSVKGMVSHPIMIEEGVVTPMPKRPQLSLF